MKKIPIKFKGTFHLITRRPVNEKKIKGTFPRLKLPVINEKKSKGLSLGLRERYFQRQSLKISISVSNRENRFPF